VLEGKKRGLLEQISNNWIKIYFGVALLALVFAYGMATAHYKLFPYGFMQNAISAARDWASSGKQYARIKPDKHLRPSRREGSEVSRHEPEKTWPGITLIAGMWGEQLGIRLVDMNGKILHEWQTSFNSTWPEATHLKVQPHDWDTAIHGMVAYPDGRIVFNYEHDGLVAIDRCSNVLWKIPELTHHSAYRADDGTLWVGNNIRRDERQPQFSMLEPPYWEESLMQVAENGEILRRISLLDVMHDSGYEGFLVDPNEHMPGKKWFNTVESKRMDITHLNDIEVLPAELADAFEQFEAGDIMVSMRNLDLVIVIDPETETIKWSNTGPWLMQHDPDFQPDGSILVFDNRARRYSTAPEYGSRILRIDPVTRAVDIVYEGTPDDSFYTSQMGKLQGLANGNVLIVEPEAGRVFEVNSEQETVWEYINRWSDTEVAFVSDSIRLPDDYFEFSSEACE